MGVDYFTLRLGYEC